MEKIRHEARKIRKPIMEKKRRQRINSSLEYLKRVLLQNTVAVPTNSGGRVAKLEKADILEMTVRYIQTLHKQLGLENCDKVSSTTQDPSEVYKALISEIKRPLKFQNANVVAQKAKVSENLASMDKENVFPARRPLKMEFQPKKNPHWRPW